MPDEEFDVLGEDEVALRTRRLERLHENRVNMRRNTRMCFKCGKTRHFFVECPSLNNNDKHKSKDKRRKPKKKDHRHGKKMRSREKMKRSSEIESDSEDTSSSSSDEDEEDEKEKKKEEPRQVSQRPLCDGPKPQGRLLWHGSQLRQQEKPKGRLGLRL
jgi:hypothetical protein